MDVRYLMLFIIFFVFTLSGVVLIVENVDENLEAAIPLFVPAGVAVAAGLYLAYCVKDEYDYAGRGSLMSMKIFNRGPRRAIDSERGGGGSRYDDGGSRYGGGGGGGRSRYDDGGGRSRYDDGGGRSRYDDDESVGTYRTKRTKYEDRPRKDRSRYDEESEFGESRYQDERRPKRKRDRRDRDRDRGRDRDRDRDRGRSPRGGRY